MNKIPKLFSKNTICIPIFPFVSGSNVAQHSTATDLVYAENFGILSIWDFFFWMKFNYYF